MGAAPKPEGNMAQRADEQVAQPSWRRWLPLVVVALLLGLALVLRVDRYLTFDALAANREWLLAAVARLGVLAPVVFALLYVAVTALSIPGASILTLTSGFLFGTIVGTVVVVIGATIGAVIIFLIARTALGETLRRRAGPFIRKLEEGFRKDAFSYLLVLRLIPAFPFWLVNLVPALLGVTLPVFALATFIGIIPASIVFVSIGNGLGALFERGERPNLHVLMEPQILLPLAGLVVLALIPVVVKRLRGNPAEKDA
jgi:uncharacterized membrane protein YdjX (TVP38/TMEM64 family)